MSFIPKIAYIVSHTHWDREWYLTYHQFVEMLTHTVREVLDKFDEDDEFKHFLLDGQSIILEDYLIFHPEDEERIRRLTEQGKLSIGPWYILPDEFLISAESHVRNLLYGHKVAQKFGGAQKIGYMPDSFGHISQMPQILANAGIDSFIFSRGSGEEIDDTGHEFIWRAPDGSEVLTLNQCRGYCNAGALGFDGIWQAMTIREMDPDRAVEQIGKLFDEMSVRSNGDIVLINNGCDHLPPQQEFGKMIGALRKAFPDTEFIHTDLQHYFDALRESRIAAETYEGELCSGKLNPIITGVWSARTYLKQLNDDCQSLLSNYLEPISAYAHFLFGHDYPSGIIEYAWKLLLKNHPHDSICGCSTDDVHREMVIRFDGLIQLAEQSISQQMSGLAPTFGRKEEDDKHTVLSVFNPLPFPRKAIVERLVVLQPFGIDPKNLRLLDQDGNHVPFRIVDKWYVERIWNVDYRRMLYSEDQLAEFMSYIESIGSKFLKSENEKAEADCFILMEFAADLPALSHVNFHLTCGKKKLPAHLPTGDVTIDSNSIENSHCRVEVHPNGTFDLTHKSSGRVFKNMNLLESSEDIGDEYDYSHCENSSTVTSADCAGETTIIEDGPLRGTIEISFDLELPVRINDDRKSRSSENVLCPVTFQISLTTGCPVVSVHLAFDNLAEDHRLRALFPASINTDTIISDGHFYLNERPVKKPSGENWKQPPMPTYPQQAFSLLRGDDSGITLFNLGLPEIEPVKEDTGNYGLALTLLRSVGWLSRDDFPTRDLQNAGPMIATPEAQCPGENIFHYAVMPLSENLDDGMIKRLSDEWRIPPVMVQGVEDSSIDGAGSLIEIDSDEIAITAVKKCEYRDTLIVRMYNMASESAESVLTFGKPVNGAWDVNVLEEREKPRESTDGKSISVKLKPHQIFSLEMEFMDTA